MSLCQGYATCFVGTLLLQALDIVEMHLMLDNMDLEHGTCFQHLAWFDWIMKTDRLNTSCQEVSIWISIVHEKWVLLSFNGDVVWA